MNLLDYTTYQDVRAALGVNDVELTDETLGLALYSSNLAVELDDIGPTLADRYDEVRLLAEETRTKVQQRLFDVTRVFAAYAVAKQCAGSLPMFGPKSISDSKTEVSRFTNDPYKATIKAINEAWSAYRSRTTSALADLSASSAGRTKLSVLRVSKSSVDPVTGS